MHVRDLNFVLRSEIFVHSDGQLRASHLILGVAPVYSTWQAFSQALLVDSPLLSYIDVRNSSFLPKRFSVGEARDLGPRYICSDERQPLRDESAERVSRALRERAHQQIEQQDPAQPEVPEEAEEPAQAVRDAAAEQVDSSGTESDQGREMVTRRAMTIGRFVAGAGPAGPQQEGSNQPSQTPPAQQTGTGGRRKRPRTGEQTQTGPGVVSTRPPSDIVICEPVTQPRPDGASTSRPAAIWQPSFVLDGEPLTETASLRIWGKGQGGCVAQSLASSLLLPEDVHAYEEASEESVGKRLTWLTMAVRSPITST